MNEYRRDVACWTDPVRKIQNVPIHKCGTSYIEHHAKKMGWQEEWLNIHPDSIRFVILRDPFERYLTAFVEDMYDVIYFRPNLKEQLLETFQKGDFLIQFLLALDIYKLSWHTITQYSMTRSLPIENTVYFKMGPNLGSQLNKWLDSLDISNTFDDQKIYARNKETCVIHNRLSDYFNNPKNSADKDRILNYLKDDYSLINSVQFYE